METIKVTVREWDDELEEKVWSVVETPVVRWKPVPYELVETLLAFVHANNVGKAIAVDGVEYVLDHISHNTNAFWRSRGLSVYYRVGRSVIRISDHWSKTNHHPRSRKLNCGAIAGAWWELADTTATQPHAFSYRSGKYPWKLLAGKAGLSKLNKSVDHWML